MEVIIKPDAEAVSKEAAALFARQLAHRPASVLGLATGSTPLDLYRELVRRHRQHGLSFAQETTFNLDEYVGLSGEHPRSYRAAMRAQLFDAIDVAPERTHVPDGLAADLEAHCAAYEAAIRRAGGIDLQLLGIGADGHIGFNEPSSSLSSRTRLKTLTAQTIADNARFFGSAAEVPRHVITMGVGTIMEARHIVLLATGARKAGAIAASVEGPITASVPGSILQMHPRCAVIIDEDAAVELRRADYYRWVYAHKPPWQKP